jgi:hypothetical protein
MRVSRGIWLVVSMGFALVVAGAGPTARPAWARGKKAPAAAAPAPAPAPAKELNACGCYKNAAGACLCSKKGRCDCPGECEPKGCEEKRAAEMEKEIAAETKKAAEADKKQREASGDEDDKPAKPQKRKAPDGVGQ